MVVMEYLNVSLDWINYTILLVQRLCVVVTAANASIRLDWLRRALRGANHNWRHRIVATSVFSLLAIVGTHSGFVFDVEVGDRITVWQPIGKTLQAPQAIVGFRDSMVLAAGLISGPWVGFGAGAVAGWERYLLGGFSAAAYGLATMLIGLTAGLIREFRPRWCESPSGALIVALLGTGLHRIMMLLMAEHFDYAMLLARVIALPVAILNILACVLFITIVRDLDRERLEHLARQAELRAWQARVEPHFLNNTLNAIKSLIRLDPERARKCLVMLGEFFNETRRYAGQNSVTLAQEIAQLRRYLEFQALRFSNSICYRENLPEGLIDYRVPPRSLQTLVENSVTHGFPSASADFELGFEAEEQQDRLVLTIRDNGRGMPLSRVQVLGRRVVASENGSGTALYQLAQSLALAFGKHAELSIESRVGFGTRVTLVLPKRTEDWS